MFWLDNLPHYLLFNMFNALLRIITEQQLLYCWFISCCSVTAVAKSKKTSCSHWIATFLLLHFSVFSFSRMLNAGRKDVYHATQCFLIFQLVVQLSFSNEHIFVIACGSERNLKMTYSETQLRVCRCGRGILQVQEAITAPQTGDQTVKSIQQGIFIQKRVYETNGWQGQAHADTVKNVQNRQSRQKQLEWVTEMCVLLNVHSACRTRQTLLVREVQCKSSLALW